MKLRHFSFLLTGIHSRAYAGRLFMRIPAWPPDLRMDNSDDIGWSSTMVKAADGIHCRPQ
ncbi:hypothetical protein [Desulfogranum mediterraneum]|uniref:hypothetical protein n=1 Tax=Desulfogranum mediterraneum TaxID=160661 RepID=UPI000402C995|nr:hypothetical protein [Desulfogranum mediterraneum]